MSVNAFLQAYGGVQNALGDPRGDEQRFQQQEAQNAMVQARFQQEQQAARAAAEAARRKQALGGALANYRAGQMYPGMERAQMPQPQRPMPNQGAPMGQAQPMQAPMGQPQAMPMQQLQFDPQGRPMDVVEVKGIRQGPMPEQSDELGYMMRYAYENGDLEAFNELFDQKRQTMTDEEKRGTQVLAGQAAQILNMPPEQRGQAVMSAIQQLGIDPSKVQIDDYLNDPVRLEQELRLTVMMGAPDDAAKGGVTVVNDALKQRNEQLYEPAKALNLGGKQMLYNGAGQSLGSYDVTTSPDAELGARSRQLVAQIQAGSAQRIARIRANTTMSEGAKNRAVKLETKRLEREIAIATGKMPLGDEVDENDLEPVDGGAD
jgi:hypothetical protein